MYQIVISNCPSKAVACHIGEQLIKLKLAACVNILPTMTSIYQWQGEIHHDNEVMMLIKSKTSLFAKLERTITELHPYEVVEVIALNIQQGNELYLNWINDTVK